MAFRVYRQGNALIIYNETDADVIFSPHATSVLIEPDADNPDIFRFYNIRNYREGAENVEFWHSDVSNLKDNDPTLPVTYTKATFIDFYTSNTGPVYAPSSGGVDSVNGQTGVVVLDADDIDDSSTTNKFVEKLYVNLDSAESEVSRVFAAGRTTFTITHNFNTKDVFSTVIRLSNDRRVGWRIEATTVNTIEASRTGNVSDGSFRILLTT